MRNGKNKLVKEQTRADTRSVCVKRSKKQEMQTGRSRRSLQTQIRVHFIVWPHQDYISAAAHIFAFAHTLTNCAAE
jgi:hypothetical protein